MFSDPVSFNGGTRVEVVTVLANCGRDTDRARRALVTWIRHKQDKGRSTEHILTKLNDIESKFIKDTSLHSAFRDARAETHLPRPPDLPLPSFAKGEPTTGDHALESAPTLKSNSSTSSGSTRRGSVASSLPELPPHTTHRTSPSVSSLRLSRDSSQTIDVVAGKASTSRRMTLPQDISHAPQSRAPRIVIPRDRPPKLSANSPVTSSPEESEFHHLRYRHMSQPVGRSSQPTGLVTPVSPSPSESLLMPTSRDRFDSRRRLPHNVAPPCPSARMPIPRARSQRTIPYSPPTSSDEMDIHPGRYRSMSQSTGQISPGRRRVTPPRSSPPEVPLPPIPSGDHGADSDMDVPSSGPHFERSPTLARPLALYITTPTRPLPIQPIPTPIPGPDESEYSDSMGENSLRQNWLGSTGDLPSDIVVRQDSPVYKFHDDQVSPAGLSPPPPYLERRHSHIQPDTPTIGDSLEKTVKDYGDSPELRLVISKCVECHRGYEPPYWQSHLQACGLNEKAVKHLVDEMCKQVDWAAMYRRAT